MTLKATKFTPEVLLSAPRRSPAVPSPNGKKALFTVSTYSFETHKTTVQFRLLDIKSGQSSVLYEDNRISEPVWLDDDEFLFLRSSDGGTAIIADNLSSPGDSFLHDIAVIDASVSNLQAKKLADGSVAIACSALATPEGKLFNPQTEEKPLSSAMVYTSLFVRHWDQWQTKNCSAIWYGALQKKDGKYSLSGLTNALAGTKLSSPVGPFGGTGDFDISESGLVFVSKDPDVNPALYTKTNLYYMPLKTFTEEEPPTPTLIETPGLEGYTSSPVFSHCGKKVAFCRMRDKQYESDKPQLLLLPDINDVTKLERFYETEDGAGSWDYRPESIVWSGDDSLLFVTAEDRGYNFLWALPSSPAEATDHPNRVDTVRGSVTDFRLLGDECKLFVTSSSLIDNSCYSVTDVKNNTTDIISSSSKQGRTFGLSHNSWSEIWFDGAEGPGGYYVHASVFRPSNFDKNKKYPLCMLIHGGPQGAWLEGWSTRWNPAIFAEQGYVVVCPNPTGSTGYGMDFQNGITGEWGGRPYKDLVACFEYITDNIPYVDTSRSVALGASYGGYMINWIQGQPLGRKFKALVCHDGCFSVPTQWDTDELFFPIHDFEGTLEENRAGYEKWDPARHIDQWATPELVIHSELDYRLPVTEGLSAFNVLQARGVPSRLLVFPDENHWVLKPENSLVWHREVLGFINKYSGVGEEEEGGAEEMVVRGAA